MAALNAMGQRAGQSIQLIIIRDTPFAIFDHAPGMTPGYLRCTEYANAWYRMTNNLMLPLKNGRVHIPAAWIGNQGVNLNRFINLSTLTNWSSAGASGQAGILSPCLSCEGNMGLSQFGSMLDELNSISGGGGIRWQNAAGEIEIVSRADFGSGRLGRSHTWEAGSGVRANPSLLRGSTAFLVALPVGVVVDWGISTGLKEAGCCQKLADTGGLTGSYVASGFVAAWVLDIPATAALLNPIGLAVGALALGGIIMAPEGPDAIAADSALAQSHGASGSVTTTVDLGGGDNWVITSTPIR